MKKDPLTYSIIGCVMKVDNTLSKGFQEVMYQHYLKIEFEKTRLIFGGEIDQQIYNEEHGGVQFKLTR